MKNNILSKKGVGCIPHFIPIEWRNRLPLAEEKVQDVIPAVMHGFRTGIEMALLNIFYFLEKDHKEAIENEVINGLNDAYRNLMIFNEGKEPKAIVFAHSLGSIILLDLTTRMEQSLNFRIEHLIMVGSPTGLFLAIRSSKENEEKTPLLPSKNIVRKIYNVNDALDPVYHRFGKN